MHSYERQAEAAIYHIGHIQIEKLSPLDLDRLYAALLEQGGRPRRDGRPARPYTRQTTMHVHRVLHTALHQARKWRLIATNPAADATPPSVPHKQARGFTEDEIRRMLEAAERDPEGYCVLALLLTTGLRRSELLGITLDADCSISTPEPCRSSNCNRSEGQAGCAGGGEDQILPPHALRPCRCSRVIAGAESSRAGMALAWGPEYHREPMFLFPGMAGVPMPPMTLTLRLRQFRRRARIGDDVSPVHGWRHSAATMMIASGVDVKTTQSRLGHSTPVITLALYADKVDERDRAAGETLAGFLTPRNKA